MGKFDCPTHSAGRLILSLKGLAISGAFKGKNPTSHGQPHARCLGEVLLLAALVQEKPAAVPEGPSLLTDASKPVSWGEAQLLNPWASFRISYLAPTPNCMSRRVRRFCCRWRKPAAVRSLVASYPSMIALCRNSAGA